MEALPITRKTRLSNKTLEEMGRPMVDTIYSLG